VGSGAKKKNQTRYGRPPPPPQPSLGFLTSYSYTINIAK
jgi:hypothetical protein